MSYGLQIYNQNGQIRYDTSQPLTKFIGYYEVNFVYQYVPGVSTQTKYVYISGISNNGNFFTNFGIYGTTPNYEKFHPQLFIENGRIRVVTVRPQTHTLSFIVGAYR